jgi:AcrR family transcriptional regulator
METRSRKDARRERILASTWRLIARDGLAATNMRSLAAEAGYANGALAYYFANKEALLLAVYEYVLDQTMQRVAARTRGLVGLSALRAFCAEIVPNDALKIAEARVVVPFWSSALTDRALAALYARDMGTFRRCIRTYLRQAVRLREIPAPRTAGEHRDTIEALLALLNGTQVLAVLTPRQQDRHTMERMLDDFVRALSRRRDAQSGRRTRPPREPPRRGKGRV